MVEHSETRRSDSHYARFSREIDILSALSPRGREIVIAATKGLSSPEIAEGMGISLHRVRNLMTDALSAFDVKSRYGLYHSLRTEGRIEEEPLEPAVIANLLLLSTNERDVMQHLEMSNAEVGWMLCLSKQRVKNLASNLYKKLRVRNRTEAMRVRFSARDNYGIDFEESLDDAGNKLTHLTMTLKRPDGKGLKLSIGNVNPQKAKKAVGDAFSTAGKSSKKKSSFDELTAFFQVSEKQAPLFRAFLALASTAILSELTNEKDFGMSEDTDALIVFDIARRRGIAAERLAEKKATRLKLVLRNSGSLRPELSERDRVIAQARLQGKPFEEIGEQLDISARWARNIYYQEIFPSAGVRKTPELYTVFHNDGILPKEEMPAEQVASLFLLSPRERFILKAISDYPDHTNAEIAAKANIEVRTIKTHVGSILKKLDRKTRLDAIKVFLAAKDQYGISIEEDRGTDGYPSGLGAFVMYTYPRGEEYPGLRFHVGKTKAEEVASIRDTLSSESFAHDQGIRNLVQFVGKSLGASDHQLDVIPFFISLGGYHETLPIRPDFENSRVLTSAD